MFWNINLLKSCNDYFRYRGWRQICEGERRALEVSGEREETYGVCGVIEKRSQTQRFKRWALMVSIGREEMISYAAVTDRGECFEEGKVPREQIEAFDTRSNSHFRKVSKRDPKQSFFSHFLSYKVFSYSLPYLFTVTWQKFLLGCPKAP